MRRYAIVLLSMILFLLALFFVVQWLQIPLLTDPRPWLKQGGLLAASISVGLLILDIFIPVPSSLVMISNGAIFGLFYGTLLSLIGGLGSALLGFAIGRRGSPYLARIVTAEERERAEALLSRWGLIAIIATRPIPLLAETVVILAGTTSIGWRQLTIATCLGNLPIALLYSASGALSTSISSGIVAFILAMAMSTLFWGVSRLTTKEE